jgi:hypothetical protein
MSRFSKSGSGRRTIPCPGTESISPEQAVDEAIARFEQILSE